MTEHRSAHLTVPCDSSCLEKVRKFVQQSAAGAGFNRTDVGRLVLAADEVCSNIVKHTYRFEPNHKLSLNWQEREEGAVLEIEDDSPTPYLPSPTDFDLHSKIKYRHGNGYGKYLMRQAVDDVQYETIPGSHNKVSLIKFRKGHEPKKKQDLSNPYDLARARSYSLLALFELGENLSRQQGVPELMKVFLYAVMGRLTTHPVALLAPISAGAPFGVAGEIGLSRRLAVEDLNLPRHGWVVESLWAQRGPFLVEDFRRLRIPEEEMETLEHLQAALLIPLFLINQLRGILCLGPKRSHQAFSEEDVNFVTLLGDFVLLLKEDIERGRLLAGGVPARGGGDLQAATRATVARLAKPARESHINLDLSEDVPIPPVRMEAELLHKVLLTLLTHVLYLSKEEGTLGLRLSSSAEQGTLTLSYIGTPLGFEKGKPGFNPLIDQMISGGLKLVECRKAIQGAGGRITIGVKGEGVTLEITFPLSSST